MIDCNLHNRRIFSLLVAILLLLPVISAQADPILIRNATLLDMTNDVPVRNTNILIKDNYIDRIWTGNNIPDVSLEAVVIDATGKFVMPALIDSHIHYMWYAGELFLAHGITTVLDFGTGLYRLADGRINWQTSVQKGLNSGKLRGPRYRFCRRPDVGSPAQPDEVSLAIENIKANGGGCIRLGMNTPEQLFMAITREADRVGLGIIAHSYDARHSSRMGVDGIEHLEGVALATIRSSEGLRAVEQMKLEEGRKNPQLYQWMERQYYDEVISELIANNVYLNPTLMHEWKGVIDRRREFEADKQRLFLHPSLQYIPMDEKLVSLGQFHWADLAMEANNEDGQVFVNNSYFIPVKGLHQALKKGYANVQEFLRRFVAAGGKLYSGTDTAASTIPGLSLHQEMQLLVDAGISTIDALASSTRWAAEIMHIDDHLGTVEPGKLADILILDANPLEDIANTRRIYRLIMAGQVVDLSYHADYYFPFYQSGQVTKHLYHQPPVITNVVPSLAIQGRKTILSITGRTFMPESVVVFNGETVPTHYANSSELTAVLGPRHTANPGSFHLSVQNPAPGGGLAEPVLFIIDYGSN